MVNNEKKRSKVIMIHGMNEKIEYNIKYLINIYLIIIIKNNKYLIIIININANN